MPKIRNDLISASLADGHKDVSETPRASIQKQLTQFATTNDRSAKIGTIFIYLQQYTAVYRNAWETGIWNEAANCESHCHLTNMA